MQIITGKIKSAQKIIIYGPEGIGKSTLASRFPAPIFIDTEGSTKHMDVARTPRPSSWTMLLEQVRYFKLNPNQCETLVVDTADWAEQLCTLDVCAKGHKEGIEDFGYGKGYIYLFEEYGKFLNLLEEVVELGINVVVTAHAQMRKFEQPDEMGGYDRWELKLQKKTAPLLKEWADMVLFANYKTYVVNVDDQGVQKGKNKAQGGKRVMYTTHHPCWDAKNRHDLAPEIPFEYAAIAHCIPTEHQLNGKPQMQSTLTISPPVPVEQVIEEPTQQSTNIKPTETAHKTVKINLDITTNDSIPKSLHDLMKDNGVTVDEIKKAVASRGYYPEDTPIENYESNFVSGVLVGAWSAVFGMIKENRINSGEFISIDNIKDEADEMPFN